MGGVRFVSGVNSSGGITAGVKLASGGGSWSSLSDRRAKTNIAKIDSDALLGALARLPMSRWSYKSQDPVHQAHRTDGAGLLPSVRGR